ncbi:unnamed protein product, partial [Ectocarpus fasciculatus]
RLHEIGEIQGCGHLLVVEEVEATNAFLSGIRIVGASENVATASWAEVNSTKELLGKDLGCLWREDCVDIVRSLMMRHKDMWGQPSPEYLSPNANRRKISEVCSSFPRIYADLEMPAKHGQGEDRGDSKGDVEILTCTLSGSNLSLYLLEVEKKHGPYSASAEPKSGLLLVRDVLGRVPSGANPQVMTGAVCDALMHELPAFDRIMVLRFAADESAEVIHETTRQGSRVTSSYVGLHFPATDIPPMTRKMLRLNGVRCIADTSAPGVPIDLLHERITAPLDLSMSALRASSTCHLDYLKNMGVTSSLVVAIIVDSELWGVYCFHSYTRIVAPSCEERTMVETAAAVTSSLISLHQRKEITKATLAISRTLAKISNFAKVDEFLAAEHGALLGTLAVDTIVLFTASRPVAVHGDKEISLTPDECKDLVNEVGSGSAVLFKSLEAKGVAYFSVRSFLVAFLRGSIARHVKWAGKPDPPLLNKETEHPRASFEIFMEKAEAEFEPWSPATVDLLGIVRHGISSHLYAEALPVDLQEVFANLSHELRTPFHGVMGSLDILQAEHAGMDVAQRHEVIDAAVLCGASMLSTLNNMIDVAKDRTNLTVARNRFITSRPIDLTVAAMRPLAAKKGIELATEVSIGSCTFTATVGDERRVRHVVQILVSNAVKFTPSGGKVEASLFVFASLQDTANWWAEQTARFDDNVWIGESLATDGVESMAGVASGSEPGASSTSAAHRWYMYCVKDTGVGIQKESLGHLVMAYRQVSHGMSKVHQGAGLGLNVCKIHVDAMSGGMGIATTFSEDSNEGRGGTLFAVALPLLLCPPAGGGGESGGENGAKGAGPHKTIALLVVDDQKMNTKLMERKIAIVFEHSHTGVQVLLATDGVTALEAFLVARKGEAKSNDGAGPIVLAGVFMDFHMPNMDGIECTRRIRQKEAESGWPPVPICGYTADTTQETRERFQDAGGDDIIYKPWQQGQVNDVCNAMLAKTLQQKSDEGRGGCAEGGA